MTTPFQVFRLLPPQLTDTPQHVKDLQLQIWLAKTPAERLRQFMVDNDAFLKFCKEVNSQLTNPEGANDKDNP